MNPNLPTPAVTPVLAVAGRILPPARPQSLPAAQAVLQRSYAPRQLTLPLRPRD